MTQNEARPAARSALVIIDLQHGVLTSCARKEGVVDALLRLRDRAVIAGVPIVWVQHEDDTLRPGTPAWDLVAGVVARPGERLIGKQYRDAFADTELEAFLTDRAVDHLVVGGAQSDYCIRATAHSALARGFDLTIVADGHTTSDYAGSGGTVPAGPIIAQTNDYFATFRHPHRRVRVRPAETIDF